MAAPRRSLDANYRAAKTFRAGDEVRPVGDVWRRITTIVDHAHSRKLTFEDGQEFWAEQTYKMEHRRLLDGA